MTAPVVTLDRWAVPTGAIPRVLGLVAADTVLRSRGGPSRRPELLGPPGTGMTFQRVLGTSRGRTFLPTEADLHHWVMVTAWRGEPAPAAATPFGSGITAVAQAHVRIRLHPITSVGRWSGAQPFGDGPDRDGGSAAMPEGNVAVLTRARVRLQRWPEFYRHAPQVAGSLAAADGLLMAFGIGEAPLGRQGTFSLWRDGSALGAFLRSSAAHRRVVAAAKRRGWYDEELFTRFTVLGIDGELA